VSCSLDGFLDAAPQPQARALRLLLALVRRPRGARLLGSLPPLRLLAGGLLGSARCENDAVARPLGWDADTVVARGRQLRRAEGRP
jgi:hypothetical protein